jgi:hypothetical protein
MPQSSHAASRRSKVYWGLCAAALHGERRVRKDHSDCDAADDQRVVEGRRGVCAGRRCLSPVCVCWPSPQSTSSMTPPTNYRTEFGYVLRCAEELTEDTPQIESHPWSLTGARQWAGLPLGS